MTTPHERALEQTIIERQDLPYILAMDVFCKTYFKNRLTTLLSDPATVERVMEALRPAMTICTPTVAVVEPTRKQLRSAAQAALQAIKEMV